MTDKVLIYGRYELYRNGDVFSIKPSGRYKLKENINNGYKSYAFSINGKMKRMLLHRLIAINFIPNPLNKPCVNHINGVKTDNSIENLEWCTYSENEYHAYKNGLKNGKVGVNNPMFGKKGKKHHSFGIKKGPSKSRKKVLDTSTGVIYSCPEEAAVFLGIKRGTLVSYLTGNDKNPTSLKYIDSDIPINQKIKEVRIMVLNLATGIFYDTIKEAAIANGINYRTLHSYLKYPNKYKNKTDLIIV